MLIDAEHDVGDERALGVGAGEGDVGFEGFVEFAGFLVALAELVLGIRGEVVVGVVADDGSVGGNRFVPGFHFLGKLTEEVGNARGVFGIRVIVLQFAEDASSGRRGRRRILVVLEPAVALEELEVDFRRCGTGFGWRGPRLCRLC